ncbi:hypothetical protein KRR40_06495 [Niabella defluvii]|nr:hypothetical protein KRR40_06495 [Niabella sp. I65]
MNLEFFAELLRSIKAHRPDLHIKGFTAVELDYMFRKAKKTVQEGMQYLKDAGLESLPGGGAEILHLKYESRSAPIKLTEQAGCTSIKRHMSWACNRTPPCFLAILRSMSTVSIT